MAGEATRDGAGWRWVEYGRGLDAELLFSRGRDGMLAVMSQVSPIQPAPRQLGVGARAGRCPPQCRCSVASDSRAGRSPPQCRCSVASDSRAGRSPPQCRCSVASDSRAGRCPPQCRCSVGSDSRAGTQSMRRRDRPADAHAGRGARAPWDTARAAPTRDGRSGPARGRTGGSRRGYQRVNGLTSDGQWLEC